MHVECPGCHRRIDVAEAPAPASVACAGCGVEVAVLPDVSSTATVASVKAAAPAPAKAIGRFEILQCVGAGAFGAVYKARDPVLGRVVALKIPRGADVAGEHEVQRFLREGRAVAQLAHPGIVAVHEVGESGGLPFLVSDFVDGQTLAQRIAGQPLPPTVAAQVVEQVAEALHYAHEHGFVHRDVKPSNIMFGRDDRPRLMDFGLAKRSGVRGEGSEGPEWEGGDEVTVTTDGQVLGTPAFMSPEQARGDVHMIDARSDVYSLGVVLFQALTGELPFRGNARMTLHQILNFDAPRPRSFNDRIPRNLEMVCLKAMSREPSHRYASAGEFAADLRRYLEGHAVVARPASWFSQACLWCCRVDRVRDAGAIGLFLGVVLTMWEVPTLLYYAFVSSSSNHWQALWQRVLLVGIFFAPIIVIAVGTLKRRLVALWVGLLHSLFGLGAALVFGFQHVIGINLRLGVDYYADPRLRVPMTSLMLVVSLVLATSYAFALVAYYSNRQSMRWYAADPRRPG